jgi:addiction module RelE/StbE family toxin
MKVVWARRAVKHLTALRDFIAADNPGAAAALAGRIIESVTRLEQHPHSGGPGRIAGTRELAVPNTPYIIPYRVRGERLELIAVFHGRQNWPERF